MSGEKGCGVVWSQRRRFGECTSEMMPFEEGIPARSMPRTPAFFVIRTVTVTSENRVTMVILRLATAGQQWHLYVNGGEMMS